MSGDTETTTQVTDAVTILENESPRCVSSGNFVFEIAELAPSAATFPLHFFVIIAMIVYRDVVKRNVVNIYAGNVIFSSVVANAWRIFINSDRLSLINNVEFVNNTYVTAETNTWTTFKRSLDMAMILVSSGSVGLTINAMRSIQFRVHRTVGGVANRATETPCTEKKEVCTRWGRIRNTHNNNPKCWAVFYILMVWLIPIFLTILSTIINRCKYACHCDGPNESTLKTENNCKEFTKDGGSLCSMILPPVGKATMAAGFALWLVYLIFLTFALVKTHHDLRNLKKQRIKSTKVLNKERSEMERLDKKSVSSDDSNKPLEAESPSPDDVTSDDAIRKPSRSRRSVAIKLESGKNGTSTLVSGSIFLESLRKNFKMLLIMYLAYVIGTSPLAFSALMDSLGEMPGGKPTWLVVVILLPIVAEAICTVMVCMYLSGVRSATRSLVVKIARCFQ